MNDSVVDAKPPVAAAGADPLIALIVGNGLTINYCRHIAAITGSAVALDPSEPLRWEFEAGGRPWQEAFPAFQQALARRPSNEKSFPSFNAIVNDRTAADRLFVLEEMRHFTALAYSYFQEELDKHHRAAMDSWAWYGWLRQHFRNVPVFVSLNYDNVLECCGCRVGADSPKGRQWFDTFHLIKPHGSIDIDSDPAVLGRATYPMRGLIAYNVVPQVRLHPTQCRGARSQPYIVLPEEDSPFSAMHQADYTHWYHAAPNLTHCVFVGVAYAECDRREIDFLLRRLNPRCVVISANPTPSADFMKFVEQERHLTHVTWNPDDPQSLLLEEIASGVA